MTITARNALAVLGLGLLAACGGSAETTPASPSPPSPPTGVVATAGVGQVIVSWTASSGATSYNLYHSTSASVSKATGTKVTGATSGGAITGLAAGTTYYFVVTAVSQGGESAESSPAASAMPRPSFDGTWAVCRNDGNGATDQREVLTIAGTSVSLEVIDHGTSDVSCDGDGSGAPLALTAAYGAQVPADLGAASVTATQVDITLPGTPPEAIYTLVYRDTSASPEALHLGDDAGAYDGSTPALRPIALQAMERTLQTVPVAVDLTGEWRDCPAATDGQIVTLNAATGAFDLRKYSGSCSAGTVVEQRSGLYSLAAPVYASLGGVTVTAFALDLAATVPAAVNLYTTVWIDTGASPRRLYHGDDSLNGMDGSSSALRPRVLSPEVFLKQ